MTAKCKMAPRLIGAAIAVAAFMFAVPGPGSAEPDNSDRAANATPDGAAVRVKRKPVPLTLQSASSPGARETQGQGRPWSIEDALPKNSKAVEPRAPEGQAASPGLGRVPLRSGAGTFGFETETKFKSNEFSDSQTVPGLQPHTRREPTYLGLSLSVPTNDKGIIPPPP